jgi:hypothetical protein
MTPAALQRDLALLKTAITVLTAGTAGKAPSASDASGAPTIKCMDVDVSRINRHFETGGQINMINNAPIVIRNRNHWDTVVRT